MTVPVPGTYLLGAPTQHRRGSFAALTASTRKVLLCLVLGAAAVLLYLTPIGSSHSEEARLRLQDIKSAADSEKTLYQGPPDLHPHCSRGNPSDRKNRPMLIFKRARSGSTWLAWSINELKLQSGLQVMYAHEPEHCTQSSAEFTDWLIEFFSRTTNGTTLSSMKSRKALDRACSVTAGRDARGLGVMVADMDVHVFVPELTVTYPHAKMEEEGWEKLFRAVPDLAVGLLVRTNIVKQVLSSKARRAESDPCGNKHNMRADDPCTKDLAHQQLTIHPRNVENMARHYEKEQKELIHAAARVSQTYGDGRLFCLSYEGMQHDLSGELAALGDYIGSPLDEGSLTKLKEQPVSYKRVSDDLSKYLTNYEEIREALSENQCLLKQLESREPENFPMCESETS